MGLHWEPESGPVVVREKAATAAILSAPLAKGHQQRGQEQGQSVAHAARVERTRLIGEGAQGGPELQVQATFFFGCFRRPGTS